VNRLTAEMPRQADAYFYAKRFSKMQKRGALNFSPRFV
jgi:hypothetical protein